MSLPAMYWWRRLSVSAGVGLANTVLYLVVYNGVRYVAGPFMANAVAVTASVAFSFWGNRRFAFGIVGRAQVWTQLGQFAVLFLTTLAVSSGALGLLLVWLSRPTRIEENAALLASGGSLVLVRFWVMHTWIFPGERRHDDIDARTEAG